MFSLCGPKKMSKDNDVLLVCSFNQEGVFFAQHLVEDLLGLLSPGLIHR